MTTKSRFQRLSSRPEIKELRFTLNMLRKSPLSIIGITIILFFLFIALFAEVLAPPEPGKNPFFVPRAGYSPLPKPPNQEHPFGTTGFQFDIYYGCIWGTRTAFYVGISTVAFSLIVGTIVGSIAGYYGGKSDEITMRITDVFYAIPYLILAMSFIVAFGTGIDSVILALVIVYWPGYARVMRGEFKRIREEDFVEAAKAIGCSDFRIITRHILPNTIFPALIMAALDSGTIVLVAATLSFLGLGVPHGYADWGQMIAFSRDFITGLPGDPFAYWYTFMIPGIFIFTFVLGWSLLGDALRDILDPMIRRK
ncbi:MAG: ABC transporter permease [Promethearchaeota archaeon]